MPHLFTGLSFICVSSWFLAGLVLTGKCIWGLLNVNTSSHTSYFRISCRTYTLGRLVYTYPPVESQGKCIGNQHFSSCFHLGNTGFGDENLFYQWHHYLNWVFFCLNPVVDTRSVWPFSHSQTREPDLYILSWVLATYEHFPILYHGKDRPHSLTRESDFSFSRRYSIRTNIIPFFNTGIRFLILS